MSLPDPVLECQDCGKILRVLAPEEAREVADQPYNYIRYCSQCRTDRAKDSESGAI